MALSREQRAARRPLLPRLASVPAAAAAAAAGAGGPTTTTTTTTTTSTAASADGAGAGSPPGSPGRDGSASAAVGERRLITQLLRQFKQTAEVRQYLKYYGRCVDAGWRCRRSFVLRWLA